jgi:shikimate 5-dehydrogenase
VDELAKLGSNLAMVPTGVALQEIHEPSISKALANATKVAESSQETPPPSESITESPIVMEIHSNWRTPFMIYFRTGGLPEDMVDRE